MSPAKHFTLFLPETPQEVRKFHPELSAELAEQRKVQPDSNSFRQTLRLEGQRAEKLPVEPVQNMNFRNFHLR